MEKPHVFGSGLHGYPLDGLSIAIPTYKSPMHLQKLGPSSLQCVGFILLWSLVCTCMCFFENKIITKKKVPHTQTSPLCMQCVSQYICKIKMYLQSYDTLNEPSKLIFMFEVLIDQSVRYLVASIWLCQVIKTITIQTVCLDTSMNKQTIKMKALVSQKIPSRVT